MRQKIERKYNIDSRCVYSEYEDHYDRVTRYGEFSPAGDSYTITNPNTPRQWMNMLYNDRFASVIANHGEGYTIYGNFYHRVTKFYDPEFYLVRRLNGTRVLEIVDLESGETLNLFDCNGLKCKVMPGMSEFSGEGAGISFTVKVFVPLEEPCECWIVELKNKDARPRSLRIHAQQAWAFHNHTMGVGTKRPADKVSIEPVNNGYLATGMELGSPFHTLYGVFSIEDCSNGYMEKKVEKTVASKRKVALVEKDFPYRYANIYADVTLAAGETLSRTVVSAASADREEVLAASNLLSQSQNAKAACEAVLENWKKDLSYNTCSLPDKNLERFLNVWLKHQLGLTLRYNRNTQTGGFRDLLQDAWGAMLIRADYSARRMDEALSHLYSDGHSMRGFDTYTGVTNKDDFVDCPLWAPAMVLQYLKETGDLEYLNKQLPYFDTEATETVEEHLFKTVNYAYERRGANGLVLMRDGDWLDGLAGINQNGTATSAWATMQAYWAQDCLAQIYDAVENTEKAELMRARNAEYKKIVREVAWDGNWYVYGFKSDGLPVGSSRCAEGKIYLNPQTWAIFTGIENDPVRIKKMSRAVDVYLTTLFGPMLLYPPYVYDKTCGTLGGQLPGTFANASVYLHAGTFKVYSDVARGEYDEAYETMMRLIPNHVDNPDSRRTSEPYTTGNVHFGPDSERYGMNLFSWFTATPAWLIHAGFDRILGVEADFDGLHIEPRVPSDWNEYQVKRTYRGKEYALSFRRAKEGEEKGIYTNGIFVGTRWIPVTAKSGDYEILY